MDTPFVSIGLVTFNRSDILHLAIEQLLAQSYKNIELIISDNASADETEKVVSTYVKKDSRVTYYRQKKNIGMHNNFNFVLSKAKGELFLWATDDDEWDPRFIEEMVSLLQKYPKAVVATASCVFFSDTTNYEIILNHPEYLTPLTSVHLYMYQAMFITYGLVRTKELRKTGGFFHYPPPIPDGIGDIIPVFRMLLQGGVCLSPEILWKKRDSGYTFDKFDLLSSLSFSSPVMMRIIRYLKFPILYSYNLYFMIKSASKSSFSIKDKMILVWLCVKFFLYNLFEYVKYIVVGGFLVVVGLLKKLMSFRT